MYNTAVTLISDEHVLVEVSDGPKHAMTSHRLLELTPGILCVVQPVNPQKLKHRGRLCKFIRNRERPGYWGREAAWVRFLDNNACGFVDYGDLVLAEEHAEVP